MRISRLNLHKNLIIIMIGAAICNEFLAFLQGCLSLRVLGIVSGLVGFRRHSRSIWFGRPVWFDVSGSGQVRFGRLWGRGLFNGYSRFFGGSAFEHLINHIFGGMLTRFV